MSNVGLKIEETDLFQDLDNNAFNLEITITKDNKEIEVITAITPNSYIADHGFKTLLQNSAYQNHPSFVCGMTCFSEIQRGAKPAKEFSDLGQIIKQITAKRIIQKSKFGVPIS